MKKIFISQPMGKRADDKIEEERQKLIAYAKRKYGNNIEVLGSYYKCTNKLALECLGEAIKILSHADVAIFHPEYFRARGCTIEHECCKEYNVRIDVVPFSYWYS